MKRTLFFLVLYCLLPWQLLAQDAASASSPRLAPAVTQPAHGEKLHLAGIHNAGKISEVLYRGAQPKETGLAELKKLGITMIVDLRADNREKAEWERRESARLGLRFVGIPVGGWSPPTDEQVAQFLAFFREQPQQKIFVHCRFGDDRTGVFVAAYRMAANKWPAEQAMGEMYFFGFNGFWHPSMKEYVRKFPERLQSSPALAALFAKPGVP
jgi:tyrosine-protein phosphatase SIW14